MRYKNSITARAGTRSAYNHCMRWAMAAAACMTLGTAAATATTFTDITAGLTAVHHGSILWGDYDNDGQLDIFETGETSPVITLFADLYHNASGVFSPISAGLPGVQTGIGRNRSAFGDYDNDNDLDLIITGVDNFGTAITNLYRNNGGGSYSLVTISPSPFPGVGFSSVAWGDFDNDGDLDLFLTGRPSFSWNKALIYRNDGPSGGGWKFTDIGASLPAVMGGDGAWGDYDNDGDMDLLVTGDLGTLAMPATRLFTNNGGVMVNSGVSLTDVGESSVCWGDFNNDGWLDIAMQGKAATGFPVLKVYLNNTFGGFTPSSWAPGFGLCNGSIACGDYDNDGNLDLVVTGAMNSSYTVVASKAYLGDGLGGFTEDMSAGLQDVYESQATFGDYDNDGRLDLLLCGRQPMMSGGASYSIVYHNTTGATPNAAPSTPVSPFVSATTWTSLTLSWGAASDAETPAVSLHYNIEVTDITAGSTIVATPMAAITAGTRWLPALGNTNHNLSWTITGLIPGHQYSACVQTIDGGWKPSPFACITPVTLPTIGPNITIRDCSGDTGFEPSAGTCGSVMWNSPDIYVRNTNDGFPVPNQVHQSPQAGQPNYVYVRLKNNGATTLASGRVYVYFAKASTGLAWQSQWVNNFISGVPFGDYIGYADVFGLGAGATTIKEILWNTVPDPSLYSDPDAHHFCLVARFVSAADPMAWLETTSIYDNVNHNNNIAWKNVSILDVVHHIGPIGVYNTSAARVTARLMFDVPREEQNDGALRHVKIKVDLGELFRLWVEGGRDGDGIQVVNDDPTNTEVWITANHAELRNITLDEGAQFTLHVNVQYPDKEDPAVAGRVFHWNMAQYEGDDAADPVGGETYDITMPGRNAGGGGLGGNGGNDDPPGDPKRVAPATPTLGQMLRLEARPNPTSAATTIDFTLPEAGRVTIAIYDANGRLVRELLSDEFVGTGTHAIAWDGTSAGGANVASGTYYCRVSTPLGMAQQQLKVAR